MVELPHSVDFSLDSSMTKHVHTSTGTQSYGTCVYPGAVKHDMHDLHMATVT